MTFFATLLLQNELNGDVASLTTHASNPSVVLQQTKRLLEVAKWSEVSIHATCNNLLCEDLNVGSEKRNIAFKPVSQNLLQNKLQVTVHIPLVPETFLARLPLVALAYLQPKLCRASANTENSRRKRKKPLVPRVKPSVPYKVLPNESKNLCTATSNPFSLSRLCSGENECIPLSLLILLPFLWINILILFIPRLKA